MIVEYTNIFKVNVKNFQKINPQEIQKIFNTFDFKKVDDKPDIIEFIKTSKKQDMF